MRHQHRLGIDTPTVRAAAVVVLLLFAAASLRGYLPGAEPARRSDDTDDQGLLIFLVVLLVGSLGVVACAVIARLRDRRTRPPSAEPLFAMRGDGGGRPSWHVLLLGLGILTAWLVLVWLLTRWVVPLGSGHGRGQVAGQLPPPDQSRTPPPPDSGTDMLGYLSLSTVIFVLLSTAAVAFRRWDRRAASAVRGDRYAPPSIPAPAESLVRAAELGLAEVGDPTREPREAIIACYAAMERELAQIPGAAPRDFDTPTEVLVRAIEQHALHADNAAQLVSLFEEARFSPHVMGEHHRDVAERVLRLVVAELRSAA